MDPSTMKTITIESNTGNEYAITHLDLSKYDDLEVLRIGNGCFKNVKEVRIVGLQHFTRERENGRRSNYRFILRDCESLKELQIGRGSFSSYSAIELENLPALTELTIGDVKAKSNNFFDSSLELKDLPQLSHVFFGESSFYACNSVVFENLPQLSSIVLGPDAFRFYESEASSFLTLKSSFSPFSSFADLSKLATIQSPATKHKSFRDVHHLHFETLPSLSIVTLPPMAFSNRESITMTNVGGLQSNPLIPCLLKEAELCSCADLRSIDAYITRLSVGNNCCNDRSLTVIDLTGNSFLQELSIGNNSLNGVRRVTIAGQKKLTSISIGNNCSRTEHTDDKAFIFSVSECPVLKEISIGSYSFSTFDQFKAANLPSLETVTLPQSKDIITGTGSFQQCESVVFENLPKLTSIRLGYNVFSFDSVKEPTSLVLQDLPRLHQFITSRRVVLGNTFRYPRRITLENMPRLTNLMLSSYAFENKKRVTVDKKTIGAFSQFFI
ncbi:leucine-rich repeat neuronal protein 1 precursor [Blastocystis sp. ATCC 50177/Nand II]|uniref:Leucine-rich repeat neuronal protein 1 n=1 Tax=Blastocystis sp. subtype 1 (strain ATCC 50177 / NandII) TaxID=478820 RepID=A0A196S7U1_BLAHN|nr:leucine-rich repeat neuronal protein 1 precursor [Blastocystis sp. ATCC 50177/Nand II]